MPPEFELLGPTWARWGHPALYPLAAAVEAAIVVLICVLLGRRFAVGSIAQRWGRAGVVAIVAVGGVIVLNGALNALVMLYLAEAVKRVG